MGERRELERDLVDARRQMATGGGGGAGGKGPRKSGAVKAGEAGAPSTQTDDILGQTAALLKVRPADVPERVEALLGECRKLEGEIEDGRREIASAGNGAGAPEVKDVGGIAFQPRLLEDVPAKELKSLADDLKNQVGSGVVALVSVSGGKASVVVGVTDDLTGRVSAVDLVRAGAGAVGGKGGGGRPDMAQAGGPDGANGQAALDAIESAIARTG